MSTTATAFLPISEATIARTQERAPSSRLPAAWEELCLLSERWRELSRHLERQAVAAVLSYSQTPSAP